MGGAPANDSVSDYLSRIGPELGRFFQAEHGDAVECFINPRTEQVHVDGLIDAVVAIGDELRVAGATA